jgi:general secretion pathway protein G
VAVGESGHSSGGFSLLETMFVITVILITATISVPFFQTIIWRARETVLRQDLFTMRKQIDQFTHDNARAPASLEELVEKGYLGVVPTDPFTGSTQTWTEDQETTSLSIDPAAPLGIADVHSGSDRAALDGTAYSSW